MESKANSSCYWHMLPDPVLLYIFSNLNAQQLVNVRQTCRNWLRLATDEFLWKKLFLTDFKIERDVGIAPGGRSWFHEYKRLKYLTPTQETEVLTKHSHQVLHVSFSHNGEMFASCSKDGYIKVWAATYPAAVSYSKDMKSFSWNYTQFSQFNESDTLLLVSGVHFGAHTASGEIAVFNIQNGFVLQCRVLNKPYDTFGTWYTDDYLLSGRLHFLGRLVSCSTLWLNKAWQESHSEKKPIIKFLYKFYNKKASSIRTITVANCLARESEMSFLQAGPSTSRPVHGNPMSRDTLVSSLWSPINGRTQEIVSGSGPQDYKIHYGAEGRKACTMERPIRYSQDFRRAQKNKTPPSEEDEDTSSDFEDPLLPWDEEWSGMSEDESRPLLGKRILKRKNHKVVKRPTQKPVDKTKDSDSDTADSLDEDKLLDPREKFLIFTLGAQTYTPHQIGFKRIKPFKFGKKMPETKSVKELKEQNQPQNPPYNFHNETEVAHLFDQVDHIIDLHGHIIGMGVSPDHRYLYVNSRSWPQGYVIENPLTPPPIAQEIDIHVIDLITLKEVGTMLRSHKAYTPNDECFFIFLDVSEHYVASGAEDKHGYLWDRHYGTCLKKLPHNDVVNSVAFNPKDPEMLVTASDDFTLKVWRSRNRVRQLAKMEEDEGPDNF